jgi:hypothetical protein
MLRDEHHHNCFYAITTLSSTLPYVREKPVSHTNNDDERMLTAFSSSNSSLLSSSSQMSYSEEMCKNQLR